MYQFPKLAFCFLILCFCFSSLALSQNESEKRQHEEWLLEKDGKLFFKFHIDVFLRDGQPAEEFSAKAFQNSIPVPDSNISIEGNRVIATLPILARAQSPAIVIRSNDDQFGKTYRIRSHDRRRLCTNGVDLELDRLQKITAKVVDENGVPVPDATVIANKKMITDPTGRVTVYMTTEEMKAGRIDVLTTDTRAGRLRLATLTEEERRKTPIEIKVTKGVKQKIRVLDVGDKPVGNLQIIPQRRDRETELVPLKGFPMRTDASGSCQVVWLPKPPGPNAFVSISDSNWVSASEDRTGGDWVVRVDKLDRIRVVGSIENEIKNAAGMLVQLSSSDHPTEKRSDQIYAIVDSNGDFEFNAIPGALYCAYIVDSEWYSSFWTGIPAEASGQLDQPKLNIGRGVPVKIMAEQGPGRIPLANSSIYIKQEHVFRTPKSRRRAGPSYYVTTDANGEAIVFMGPGAMDATLYSPEYNDNKKIVVKSDQQNKIVFHRERIEMQTISGQLEFQKPEESESKTSDVFVHATDGKNVFSKQVKTNANGQFELQGLGDRFAIMAISADKKLAGHLFASKEQAESIIIPMTPTVPYRGRLLDSKRNPIANCGLSLEIRLRDPLTNIPGFLHAYQSLAKFKSQTNDKGEFEFQFVPTSTPLVLMIEDTRFPESYLGKKMLFGDDDRQSEVIFVGGEKSNSTRAQKSIEERFRQLEQDCRINKTNQLLILIGEGENTNLFAENCLPDFNENKSVFWYLPVLISHESLQKPEVKKLFADRNIVLPKRNQIVMAAIDHEGKLLDSLAIANDDSEHVATINEFLERHKGEYGDAKAKLDSAFELARKTERRVWATTGHTRCRPCFMLSRWIDSQRKILDQYYVFVKIDSVRDKNAIEVTKRICGDKNHGVPFFCIFENDGSILVDSESPLGNIGFPGPSYEAKLHLGQMLTQSSKISKQEIEKLLISLQRD